jgi:hypothetical protein
MWQDDAERRERTKVVPIEPGSYIVSPASKVRAVMRCTHAIHFAGGIERLKRHETMTVPPKILVRTSFALTANYETRASPPRMCVISKKERA